jgi:hemolysin D
MSDAELGHLKSDLLTTQLDVARLRAALAERANPLDDFHPPAGANPTLVEMQRQFLISQSKEQNSKLAEIDRQLAQKEAERATISTTIAKLNATIPLLQQRVDVRKVLYDKELGSKLTYLTELGDLVGQQQDLLVQQSRYREADAAVAALAETRAKIQSEYRRSLFDELAKAEQKAGGLAQDVIKAEQRTKLQILTAPVDGVVQQLAVHTVGGVVTPAQALAVVVPIDSHLEIEAMVSNRDIGFVYAGQQAEIKIDTFSFTRYGLLHGQVVNVSQDSITREKPSDKSDEKALAPCRPAVNQRVRR